MNYADSLQLRINKAYVEIKDMGCAKIAESIDIAAKQAGTDVTRLMAACDYAEWQLQRLRSNGC